VSVPEHLAAAVVVGRAQQSPALWSFVGFRARGERRRAQTSEKTVSGRRPTHTHTHTHTHDVWSQNNKKNNNNVENAIQVVVGVLYLFIYLLYATAGVLLPITAQSSLAFFYKNCTPTM